MNRSVQSLQIAIHYNDQVIQLFARRNIDGAQYLRFIRFTITDKCPDFAAVVRF